VTTFTVRLRFHGDLRFFIRSRAHDGIVERKLGEKTSVKDAIESCGVPHPEVDLISVNGRPVNFRHISESDEDVDVYPVDFSTTFFNENRLQVTSITRFVADGHLGSLSRNLRLLGFDVAYDREAQDPQLLNIMTSENRALLTRDRHLLMHAVVQNGYYPRSQDADEQTVEVVRRFDLCPSIDPFSRCLRCNSPLQKIEKAQIIEKLEPLTKIYYEQFRRCTGCGQIYWAGSHFSKLRKRVERIRTQCSSNVT
jgi:uncharacterized protein with PIN domain/sulfur carrier protein ThiS